MAKFHSTLSRRDFMKALGLGAMGVGAAGAATAVMHDIDEMTASSTSIQDLPWWVKEKDFKKPTVEIDWTAMSKSSGNFPYQPRPTETPFERYEMGVPGGTSGTWASVDQARTLLDSMKKEFPGWEPGYIGIGDNRTSALFLATKIFRMGTWPQEIDQGEKRVNVTSLMVQNGYTGSFLSWRGFRSSESLRPQQFNYPRWEGTPEENLRTIRHVVRFLGGSEVGVTEMDDDVWKLFHEFRGGKKLVREDVEDGYETADKVVIPTKCKYILQYSARQPYESTRRQAGEYEDAAVYRSYQLFPMIGAIVNEFIYNLGYTSVLPNYLGMATGAIGTLNGMGEHCRMSSPILTPKYGTTCRAMWIICTDLPLMPTKPVDFGSHKFCKTCGLCSDTCPFGLVDTGDPAWEREDAPGSRPGFLGYRTDTTTCPHCPVCQGTCPFNTNGDGSFVHDMVRNVVSVTPLFNGFFANMEGVMGYGRKDPRDWWDIKNDYSYGINTKY